MQDLDTWRKAGRIAAQALDYGRGLIRNGANIRETCDAIDAKVVELGARPAWPSQVGLDHVAAHATPDPGEDAVFDGNVVCLDVGAHIDGCIGDNATTVDLSGKHADLLRASEEALDNAIKAVGAGVAVGDIGQVIQDTITSHGFLPVRNLAGHGVSRWVIHDKPSIPNHGNGDRRTLQEGEVIAIEPFATEGGVGSIQSGGPANIFALVGDRPMRSPQARDVLAFVKRNYQGLPFTTRWLAAEFGVARTRIALGDLARAGILQAHAPLVEKGKGMVAVFEKTMLVGDKADVLTKLD